MALILAACSTTRIIPEGESRLKANKIVIENSKTYSSSNLLPYLKQKPNSSFIFGWNPFVNIYNWSNGKEKGWDKFVKKIGQAPVIFDRNLVASSKTNMNNHLIYEGYYHSAIRDTVITKKKKSTVIYTVRLGQQYNIDTVTYVIPDTALQRLFFADTLNTLITKGSVLSEDRLEKESQRVAQRFRNQGYYGFTKNYFFFEADTLQGKGTASLQITIADYTRNEQAKEAKHHRSFTFGSVYITPVRGSTITQRQRRSTDSLGIKRRKNTFRIDTLSYKGINIIYGGKPLLRPGVVARMNMIQSGTLYREDNVSNTYRRFSNLGIFNSVNVQLSEQDSSKVESNIRLMSSALQGYKINLEASSNSTGLLGISPTISYYHKNLFRGGEVFSLSFMGNFQFEFNSDVRSTEFGVSTSLSLPDFLLFPDKWFKSIVIPRTEISFSYNYQERPEYTRNIISAAYGYSWSSKNKFFFKITPIQINIVKLFNISESFYESLKDPFLRNSYQDHFDLGLGTNFYYTTDASSNPSHSYFYLRWQNDLAGNFLSIFNKLLPQNEMGEHLIWGSPYSQYYRTEISAVYTWKFGKSNKQALATRLLVGAGTGYGNSLSMPFEKLFWAGGAYSLRAWQARTVGPGYAQLDTAFTIPNQTGDIRLEGNIEYRFPLFWSFDGAVFVDAGNVWTLKRDARLSNDEEDTESYSNEAGQFKFSNFYRHIATDWGIGLRLNLGFALLRLDWGLKLYDPPSNRWMGPKHWFKKGNYGIQFGVGYPF